MRNDIWKKISVIICYASQTTSLEMQSSLSSLLTTCFGWRSLLIWNVNQNFLMKQRASLVMHGTVLSSMTSVCKVMPHPYSQTDRIVNEGGRLGSFEKGNYLSWVLISIFSDVKAKMHQYLFPFLLSVCLASSTGCKLWELTEQKWNDLSCPKQSSYFHFNVLTVWEYCMEWNVI